VNRGDANVRFKAAWIQQPEDDQHQCHAKFERHAEAFGNDDAEENDGAANN
jgi:hypothetical protein